MSCKVFLLVRVCVWWSYTIHTGHTVYIVCTSVGGAKSLVSLVTSTCWYLRVGISHSRQATLYVGGAICWKPSRQRQGHRENLTQHPASLLVLTTSTSVLISTERLCFLRISQTSYLGFCHFFDFVLVAAFTFVLRCWKMVDSSLSAEELRNLASRGNSDR